MKTLLEIADVRDPRGGGGRKKHVFKEIIAIAILAKLAGAQTFNEMEDFGKCRRVWLGTFLSLPRGIPSHDTFNRAIRSIPAEEFEARFRAWAEAMRSQAAESGAEAPRRIVAVDGKALRRAGSAGKAPVIVGAWDERTGIALGQEQVQEKSNEIMVSCYLLSAPVVSHLSLEGICDCGGGIVAKRQPGDAAQISGSPPPCRRRGRRPSRRRRSR